MTMEHHDWGLPDDGSADADTADLGDDGDFGAHLPGGFGDELGPELGGGDDLGGHDLGSDVGHELGADLGRPDALDEPLGTENAAAHFDAALAGHDGGEDPDGELHGEAHLDLGDGHDGGPDADAAAGTGEAGGGDGGDDGHRPHGPADRKSDGQGEAVALGACRPPDRDGRHNDALAR